MKDLGQARTGCEAIKILAVFGTRPEAIKMAPVVKALESSPEFQVKTVVTAQHREMLDQVLRIFKFEPEYDLNIMSPQQSLTEVTSRVLEGMEPILKHESPDLLLVHGDTTTTFASSLAAFYQGIKVAHVEAGLRTGDKLQPYPEEMNRLLTSKLSDIHFAPTLQARANLLQENIAPDSIFVTGNTVIDALLQCHANLPPRPEAAAEKRMVLVTAHRRENWGEPLTRIISALKEILNSNPDLELLIPVHLNPTVRREFQAALGETPRVQLVEPLDYEAMVAALAEAYFVITDSGGIQEEAPSLGKPVLVLREKTERPEALAAGTVALVGTEPTQIVAAANRLLQDREAYARMSHAVNPYGDGKAAARIMAALRYIFGLSREAPADFSSKATKYSALKCRE